MSRRSERERRADIFGFIFYAFLGTALLIGIGIAAWWVRSHKIEIDATTNCPKSGPRAVHVFLFDRTDPITPQQGQLIKQKLARYVDSAKTGERFDFYTVEGDEKRVLMPHLQACSPGRGVEANELYENPKAIQRKFEEQFVAAIRMQADELLQESTKDNSPIIESIRGAAITSFGRFDRNEIPLRMTIISDLIQHSAVYSQYRSDMPFTELSKRPAWLSARPNLKGSEIEILYLLRSSGVRQGRPIQTRGHQLFWEQLLTASDGRVIAIDPL